MEKRTRRKKIQMIKVNWDYNGREKATWETKNKLKVYFPEWFKKMGKNQLGTDSGMNPIQVGETCSTNDPQ